MNAINFNPAAEAFLVGFGETTLGAALVAARSDMGVAALLLGDDRTRLWREPGGSLPDARLLEDAARMVDTVAEVVAFIDAPQHGLALPLDMRGSDLELLLSGAGAARHPLRRDQDLWRSGEDLAGRGATAQGGRRRPAPPMSWRWRSPAHRVRESRWVHFRIPVGASSASGVSSTGRVWREQSCFAKSRRDDRLESQFRRTSTRKAGPSCPKLLKPTPNATPLLLFMKVAKASAVM